MGRDPFSAAHWLRDSGSRPFRTSLSRKTLPSCEARSWDEARIQKRVLELLQLVGSTRKGLPRAIRVNCPGGQRQRVGRRARAGCRPAVLLMDEPFGALDPLTRASLQKEFVE